MPAIERLADYPTPVWRGDEVLLTQPGYDPALKTFTDPAGPEPKEMTLEIGLELLDELLSGFCFAEAGGEDGERKGEHYKLSAIAYLLTCHCRFLIEPERAPIFYAGGNRPGVGKDYLLGLGPVLATGRNPDFFPPTKDSDETRKRILSICRAGHRFMIISNCRGHLADEALEQAATSTQHTDRILGKSEDRTLPNKAVYAISGNQLSYNADLARRLIDIELAYHDENIEDRRYKVPDLYAHVMRNRARFIGALQSMVETWAAAGCPDGSRTKASFGRWARVVGGIMEACGLPNPIGEGQTSNSLDEEAEHYARLLKAIPKGQSLTNHELQAEAMENELFPWLGDLISDRRAQTRFGLILKKMEMRRFGGLYTVADRTSQRTRWRVVEGN